VTLPLYPPPFDKGERGDGKRGFAPLGLSDKPCPMDSYSPFLAIYAGSAIDSGIGYDKFTL